MTTQRARSVSICLFSGEGEQLSLLLIKRKYPPFVGDYALPGGFLRADEQALSGALRKLQKETQIQLLGDKLLELARREDVGRDPRGPTTHYSYAAHIIKDKNFPQRWAGETVAECIWLPVMQLSHLAFDHGAIVCEALSLAWPDWFRRSGAPQFHFALPAALSPKKISLGQDVVFFPGSFNPWHSGHRACTQLCPNQNMLVLPDRNPWKAGSPGHRCRLKILLDIAKELATTPLACYPGMVALEAPNPTAGWLLPLKAKSKWLLLGMDSFLDLPRWNEAANLVAGLSGIYVAPRDGDQSNLANVKKQLLSWNSSLQIVMLQRHDHQDVSSSQLRALESESKKT